MEKELQEIKIGGIDLKLYTGTSVFKPNLTTQWIAKNVEFREGCTVMELGCGVGPLAVVAAKKGAKEVYAVDIMPEACAYARINADLNGVADRVRVIQGNLFEPVQGKHFDIIIDDVSAMSEEVSRISPWYPDTIPSGGYDGTEPTINMLNQAKEYLAEGGLLYFPLISLSNASKILDTAKAIFGNSLTKVSEKTIPFCNEFKKKIDDLERLKQKGLIDFVRVRSRYFWSLQIYEIKLLS